MAINILTYEHKFSIIAPMQREVCDTCGDAYDKDSEGDAWWIADTTGDFSDYLKTYFCRRCAEERYEWTDEQFEAFTVKCAVCGTVSHLWPTTHNMVRVSPGIFACREGGCDDTYHRYHNVTKEAGLATEVHKAKASRPVKWKPRAVGW